MFNVRLAGGHLYGQQLFTWLSLVVSLTAFFVLFFFPLDVLDEIWDLIESVSEGFLTYTYSSDLPCRRFRSSVVRVFLPVGMAQKSPIWERAGPEVINLFHALLS